MGMFDSSLVNKARDAATGAAAKAKDFAGSHPDQLKSAIGRAEGLAQKATGGKFTDNIAKARERAAGVVDKLAEK